MVVELGIGNEKVRYERYQRETETSNLVILASIKGRLIQTLSWEAGLTTSTHYSRLARENCSKERAEGYGATLM